MIVELFLNLSSEIILVLLWDVLRKSQASFVRTREVCSAKILIYDEISFLEIWKIFDNVFNKNDDDDVNWFESSFIIDSIWIYRDLKTQNSLNVRYFSVLTQKSLQASRKIVLFTVHFDEYFESSANVAQMIRDLILIIDDICDFIRMMMIIWTI